MNPIDSYFGTVTTIDTDRAIARDTARESALAEYATAVAAARAARDVALAAVGIAAVRKSGNGSAGTGKSRIFDKNAVITVINTAHGLRAGAVNAVRFEILETGLTVGAAHKLGVDSGYLRFYVDKGLIAIA
jgi:hypothetical protein